MCAATVRIGISGFRYPPWRGVFYPRDLPQHAELAYAARRFSSIEINGSFYSLQRPEFFQRWHDETPDDFVFAVKGPRFITHMKKLREPETALANFLASGLFNLRAKLGPILWQFPEQVRYDRGRFAAFFELLPKDTQSALSVARRRDVERMRGRARLAIDANRPLRHAVEIRSESFLVPDFVDLLQRHQIALVIAETAKRWPMPEDVTADFVYLRLHGDQKLYQSGYGARALQRWAQRIDAWRRGEEPEGGLRISGRRPRRVARDVYCYFDNTDVKLRAPFDAQRLQLELSRLASAGHGPSTLGVSPKVRGAKAVLPA